jgi:hypothetical protein
LADEAALGDVVTRRKLLAFASALAALAVAGGAVPGAEDRGAQVSPYLRALEMRATGEIDARASGEPRRASAPATPYEGVSLLAFPYAADVEARLDAIKRQQRGSMANYTEAHAEVTAVREAYERELLAAGAGELIRGAVSDATGRMRLEGVPAGEWLLLGWREESHAVKAARTPNKDSGHFATTPRMTGYGAVSYWRMRVSLRAGETAEVSLTDRSVWLSAVREELTYPDDAVKKSGSSKKRW